MKWMAILCVAAAVLPAVTAADEQPKVGLITVGGQSQAGPGWFAPYVLHGQAGQKTKVTYLGVVVAPVSPALAKQLGLPDGVGLVVNQVEDKSPAAEAGVSKHDVLHLLDDQILINPPQLAVLVRLHKPGDEVKLTVIQAGKKQALKVKLGQTETFVPGESLPWNWWWQQPNPGWQVGPGGTWTHRFGSDGKGGVMIAPTRPGAPKMQAPTPKGPYAISARVMNFADKEHSISIECTDGRRWIVVKDKDGKLLYKGRLGQADGKVDVTTVEGLPKAVQDKLKSMQIFITREGMNVVAGGTGGSARVTAVAGGAPAAAAAASDARVRALEAQIRALQNQLEQARKLLDEIKAKTQK